MISKFSTNLAKKIDTNIDSDDSYSFEKIKYSLEIIIGEFSKLLILFLAFYYLNLFNEFIISFLLFSAIKPFTGGIHFSTYWRCLGFSFIFFYTVIFLSNRIILLPLIVYIPIFIIISILIYFYAPAKSKYREFQSSQTKKHMRNISTIMTIFIGAFSIFSNSLIIINSSMFTMILILIQVIFLSERRV